MTIGDSFFSGSIDGKFNSKKEYSGQNSFTNYSMFHVKKGITLRTRPDQLRNYLDDFFLEDLEDLSPDQIVQDYGTHVLTDVKIWGRLDLLYRADISSTIDKKDKEKNAKTGLNISALNIFGINTGVGGGSSSTIEKTNKNQKLIYSTQGGDVTIMGEYDFNTGVPKINIKDWVNSITKNNSSVVDVDWSKAYPIYDFIDNPVKKQQVKLAVERYIENRQLEVLTPVYEYWSKAYKRHRYVTEKLDLSYNPAQYEKYENPAGHIWIHDDIEGKCQIVVVISLFSMI